MTLPLFLPLFLSIYTCICIHIHTTYALMYVWSQTYDADSLDKKRQVKASMQVSREP